ncbi:MULTISPECIES: head decoration protein [Serratia]|uniref:head decoration protein n=1 Tax=Serratia TaxID=613 RepID=UPI000744EE82|nr:head decoration protein [Serratia marcescens]MBH3002295.1 head decoration protein [Serratia marcescens]MBN3901333.1 head decoration protein [Serratia marcescens]MBN3913299.1 head decoration protein [Serratia marcescens]MBN3918543.1 head decoration protein [Serratia marcescens]MBN3935129.1 head decoration protein [Serratia marcescens]
MDQFGQNQFAPGMESSLFVPDQLVSGPLQLVTDSVTIGVSGALKRGTVLGLVTATGAYIPSKKDATDGSEKPSAILVDNVDTTTTAQTGGVYLMGEFNQHRLIFDATWTIAELKVQFRPLAIFLRDSIQSPVS